MVGEIYNNEIDNCIEMDNSMPTQVELDYSASLDKESRLENLSSLDFLYKTPVPSPYTTFGDIIKDLFSEVPQFCLILLSGQVH